MKSLNTWELKDIEHLKVHGRTTKRRSPLTLFWTGSGVECNVKASELWVELEAEYDSHEPWISILVNGAQVGRQMITKGRHLICLFRGMNEEVVKNVRIIKDVQAMSGDHSHHLMIHALQTEGIFLPVEDKLLRIEVIGDSITSGEGTIGAKPEEDWISMWFSAQNNYATMIGQMLDAEVRILSQSGWGVLTSWDNNPKAALPLYYEKVCGLAFGEKNQELGAQEENDFDAWQPEVIVINLGTNDTGAFHNPEYKEEATGKIYKQRLKEDGSFHEEDVAKFEEAVTSFLQQLRTHNQNAQLLWAYGMLGTPLMPAIKRGVEAYQKQSKDEKVSVLELPEMTEEEVGARSHPGIIAHQNAAEVLTNAIRKCTHE